MPSDCTWPMFRKAKVKTSIIPIGWKIVQSTPSAVCA